MMDRRDFLQGTATAALTASALPQIASASPSEFVVGGIPADVVARIFEDFGEGGFTCLPMDDWARGEIGLMVFRHFLGENGERMGLAFSPMWPLFDVAFEPRYEEVSLTVLAERMTEVSPEDVTVAIYEVPQRWKIGFIRYDLKEHVAHVLTAVVRGGIEVDPDLRAVLDERRLQIQEAWGARLAQRNAEAEQLTRENPWTMLATESHVGFIPKHPRFGLPSW